MSDPHDQEARVRFARELHRNFSVVASAGSGKTRAITERIVRIAQASDALDVLPRLVVVTFTNRAADEMQQRTRQEVLRSDPSLEVITALNRAYFGTIHGFCLKLLTEHGHYLGLPAPLELVTDDDDLWQEFVQQQATVGRTLPDEARTTLVRVAHLRDLMEFGRNAELPLLPPAEIGPCPQPDFSAVYGYRSGRGAKNIEKAQLDLREWEERFEKGWEFLRWPLCSSNAEKFVSVWREAFRPLRRWVGNCALVVAAEVQRDYREFRLEHGVVTYADQLILADELLQHPIAAERIRSRDYHVILDEAQDTDPTQFSVLLEATRPPLAKGRWLENRSHPPRPGRFCMVGDFQQSIYRVRADLRKYREVHQALLATEEGDALTLSVTFRLDRTQVDFVNATFRDILNNEDGQVEFVELQPRPEVLPGQVIRVGLPASLIPEGKKLKESQKAEIAAAELARWIKTAGLATLRAATWRDVAVLCPRKVWLRMMALELRKLGLPVSVQSESELKADNPAFAWLAALCAVMVDPRDTYETVGILREIFGLSDHDLADFAEGRGERFELISGARRSGVVGDVLGLLARVHGSIGTKPLYAAVACLVEETDLRERLLSLPAEDYGDLGWELDSLLAQAAEMEAGGETLGGFAAKLRADLERQGEVQPRGDDAIQLITAHKAKGLEWQTVIVPFLARDIRTGSPRYPCLLTNPATGELLVALGKDDRDEDVKAAVKLADQQELERLLYVATTRARHTLVLAHDRDIFLNSKTGKVPHTSLLAHLRADAGGINAQRLLELPTAPVACSQTASIQAEAARGEARLVSLPPVKKNGRAAALQIAADFPRKFNPSGYDDDPARERPDAVSAAGGQIRIRPDTPATLYGEWWHSLMEKLPWAGSDKARGAAFHALHSSSPAPERGVREWEAFRTGFLRDPMVTAILSGTRAIVHRELPFLWKMEESACLEGIIDLLIIDQDKERCLLVDWKTNQVERGAGQALTDRYLAQVTAYWKVAATLTSWPVTAALYATATGEILVYPEKKLREEWKRLESVPALEREAIFAPDDLPATSPSAA